MKISLRIGAESGLLQLPEHHQFADTKAPALNASLARPQEPSSTKRPRETSGFCRSCCTTSSRNRRTDRSHRKQTIKLGL